MTRVSFYHLQTAPLEQALPQLLEKAVSNGHRVLILTGSAERAAYLDAHLWTYDPGSFLAHGAARDGFEKRQPIFISDRDDNPNDADLLVLTDNVPTAQLARFERCLTLFDGQDEEAVQKARMAWKEWSAAGHGLIYYQQTERGGWQEKARSAAQNKGEQNVEG